jgi:hypothetical protein
VNAIALVLLVAHAQDVTVEFMPSNLVRNVRDYNACMPTHVYRMGVGCVGNNNSISPCVILLGNQTDLPIAYENDTYD